MDTTERRERIARTLTICAEQLLNGDSGAIADVAHRLFELSRAGKDIDRLARLVAESEYYECEQCGTDLHTERERYGRECREYARG